MLKFSGIGKSVESMSEPQLTADSGAALNGPLADSGALNGPLADSGALNGDCTSGPFIIGAGGLRKESLNKIGMYLYRNKLRKNSDLRMCIQDHRKGRTKAFCRRCIFLVIHALIEQLLSTNYG